MEVYIESLISVEHNVTNCRHEVCNCELGLGVYVG